VLVATKFNVTFLPLWLCYVNTSTCFSKNAENLTTYGVADRKLSTTNKTLYHKRKKMEFKFEAAETKAEEISNEKPKSTKREPRDGHALLSAVCWRYWQFNLEEQWRSCQAMWRSIQYVILLTWQTTWFQGLSRSTWV